KPCAKWNLSASTWKKGPSASAVCPNSRAALISLSSKTAMATLATKNERPGARAPELLFASLRPLELLTRSAREVLAFAFARGTSEADLLGSFARRSLESTIDSKSIEQDLFIDELLK